MLRGKRSDARSRQGMVGPVVSFANQRGLCKLCKAAGHNRDAHAARRPARLTNWGLLLHFALYGQKVLHSGIR